MSGSATLTTVPSRKAIPEPSTAMASTQRPGPLLNARPSPAREGRTAAAAASAAMASDWCASSLLSGGHDLRLPYRVGFQRVGFSERSVGTGRDRAHRKEDLVRILATSSETPQPPEPDQEPVEVPEEPELPEEAPELPEEAPELPEEEPAEPVAGE